MSRFKMACEDEGVFLIQNFNPGLNVFFFFCNSHSVSASCNKQLLSSIKIKLDASFSVPLSVFRMHISPSTVSSSFTQNPSKGRDSQNCKRKLTWMLVLMLVLSLDCLVSLDRIVSQRYSVEGSDQNGREMCTNIICAHETDHEGLASLCRYLGTKP